jgi:tRNA-(ms[2]io[6]A)-hydroxylase
MNGENALTVDDLLYCATPESWLCDVPANLDVLLIDHANCEKKAASTALNLMYRYVDDGAMLQQLSRLAREELRHFEQVVQLMSELGIDYVHLASARYAGGLRQHVRTHEPARLVDLLLVSAVVEARSCERFEKLCNVVPVTMADFYQSLLASEARHFQTYLALAARATDEDLSLRLGPLLETDRSLILEVDTAFRFHSGPVAGLSSVPMGQDDSS